MHLFAMESHKLFDRHIIKLSGPCSMQHTVKLPMAGRDISQWLVICNAAGALIVQPLDVGQKLLSGFGATKYDTWYSWKVTTSLVDRTTKDRRNPSHLPVICFWHKLYIYICFGGISPDTIPINGLQAGNCTVLVHPSLRIEHVHNPTAFAKNRRLFCSSSLLQKVKTRSENHWPVRKQAVLAELHWRLHRTGYFEPTANAEYRNIFHPLPVVLSMSTVQQKVGDFPTWSTGRPLWWNWNKQFTWCCCKY